MMRDNQSGPDGGWEPAEDNNSSTGPDATEHSFGPQPYHGYYPSQPYGYYPPPPPPPRRRGRRFAYLLLGTIAAAAGAGATVALSQHDAAAPPDSSSSTAGGIPSQQTNAPGTTGGPLDMAKVERKVKPALVDITAKLEYNSETAEGTGMIVSRDGLVLTNNHVIDNSTSITALLAGTGRTYRAKVLGYDATGDIALLQLEGASGLPVVNFGDSSQVTIGSPVLALGNAEGRGGVTPAQGIINALGRSIDASDEGSGGTERLRDMEQTSAQIQQGDSGGALVNSAGQVIGMITAANTASGQRGATIGFAIPIDTARSVAAQIAGRQASTTVYIGQPGFLGVVVANSKSSSPRQQAADENSYLASRGGADGGTDGGANGGAGYGGGTGQCIATSLPAMYSRTG